jgi:hypothetical protein
MLTLLDAICIGMLSNNDSPMNREARARLDATAKAERLAKKQAKEHAQELAGKEEQARKEMDKARAHYMVDCPPFREMIPLRPAFIYRDSDFEAWRRSKVLVVGVPFCPTVPNCPTSVPSCPTHANERISPPKA